MMEFMYNLSIRKIKIQTQITASVSEKIQPFVSNRPLAHLFSSMIMRLFLLVILLVRVV